MTAETGSQVRRVITAYATLPDCRRVVTIAPGRRRHAVMGQHRQRDASHALEDPNLRAVLAASGCVTGEDRRELNGDRVRRERRAIERTELICDQRHSTHTTISSGPPKLGIVACTMPNLIRACTYPNPSRLPLPCGLAIHEGRPPEFQAPKFPPTVHTVLSGNWTPSALVVPSSLTRNSAPPAIAPVLTQVTVPCSTWGVAVLVGTFRPIQKPAARRTSTASTRAIHREAVVDRARR